jgi:bifunctional N-acetylglucosamine-1-phosphate-uridyltransferase/glucosamine-1-phosphate-acetyltransferase GlmU-like protein
MKSIMDEMNELKIMIETFNKDKKMNEIVSGKFENGNEYRIIKDEKGHVRLILEDEDRQKIETKTTEHERIIYVESFSYPE